MIKRIELTNFFSFRKETIELNAGSNLTIGINGSGKSNFFKALRLLKVGVEGNQDNTALQSLLLGKYGGFDAMFCQSAETADFDNSIGLTFTFDKHRLSNYGFAYREDVDYKIVVIRQPGSSNYYISEKIASGDFVFLDFMNGRGKVTERTDDKPKWMMYDDYNPAELTLSQISEFDKERYLPLVVLKRALRQMNIYSYFDTTEDSKIRRSVAATSSIKQLLPDGRNLGQILNQIKIQNKPSYRQIITKLADVNEYFEGISFQVLGAGTLELYLDEIGLDKAVHISQVSDGTLRYLCIMAILYNPDRGSFICIDEPEVGLHPDMIYNVAKAIKDAAETSTIIVSTHSPELLNLFSLENILVFEKNEQNATEVSSYGDEDFKNWYDSYLPGKMWVAGDLGGKRW